MRYPSTPVLLALLVLTALLAGGDTPVAAAERQMIVSVLDDDGAPVNGLGVRDFDIREDGVAREVLRVGPAGAGRQIALLVDTSQAASRAVVDFRKGLAAFVDAMADGNRLSLITFGGPPRIVVSSTPSAADVSDGIGRLFALPDQASYLLDAVRQTAEGFTRQNAERPVIVVLATEGIDYSRASSQRALEPVEESGAAVYTLSVRVDRDPFAASPNVSSSELESLARERNLFLARGPRGSGGRHRDLLVSMAVETALRDIAAELRNQYLVVYSRPDALIPPEDIDVSATRQGLTARGTPLKAE